MFIRREGAGIDVDVGINFDGCNSDAIGFENRPDATRDDAFPNPAYHASRHQNVLHNLSP